MTDYQDDPVAILIEPQFTKADVLAVAGVSDGQLKGILDRQQVLLTEDHNPGTGRRRMFTGLDILKIAAAQTMSAIGFPMRWSYILANEISERATRRLLEFGLKPGLTIATYPLPNDEWERVYLYPDGEVKELPVACQILQADRLIDEILKKLHAVVNEQPVPTFDHLQWPTKPTPPLKKARGKKKK